MLGIAVPEEYNRFGQDFVTQMLVAETTGAGYSFSVAYMCHCGIGTMPILYYGNNEQRLRYVSRLATGGDRIILPHRAGCRQAMPTPEKPTPG